MKKYFSLLGVTIVTLISNAQIPKTAIVEHFTNSNCGVCAYNNPFIFDTLSNFPDVLHIAFHPSSPYTNCFFSMQNPVENDARTNFYGVFGGTPKLIVNGAPSTLANLNANLLAAASDSCNFSLGLTQEFVGVDSVLVRLMIKKVAPDLLGQALLFIGAVEDTIFQTTGNGETVHRNVFRKALTNVSGDTVLLPANVNDSVVFNYLYKVDTTWDSNRMNSVSILQSISDKKLINAALSENIMAVPNGLADRGNTTFIVYPNPAGSRMFIQGLDATLDISLLSIDGEIIHQQKGGDSLIDVGAIENGLYLLRISNKEGMAYKRVIIQH